MTRCNATNNRKLVDQRLQTYKQVTLEEHPIDSKFDTMPWRRVEKLKPCMSSEINGKGILNFNSSKNLTQRCGEQGHTCISILASVSKWKPTCPNQGTDMHWQSSKTSPGYYKIINKWNQWNMLKIPVSKHKFWPVIRSKANLQPSFRCP